MNNSYLGQSPVFGDFPFQILTGDGTTTYTLTYNVSSENGMLVFLNGAVQRPGIDFTASGNVIVFSEAIPAGIQIFTYGMGLPKTVISTGESIANAVPLFSVQWWPSRTDIPAGYVPADGQELPRNLYPDASEGVLAGRVPVTTDTNWISDNKQRGKYTTGNGTTTFRVPDYNGKSAGSLGATFLRGDGVRSSGDDGTIQLDELKSHVHTNGFTSQVQAGSGGSYWAGLTASNTGATGGTETRPLNVTGCWIIKLFGSVVNVGGADVSQLASDYSGISSRLVNIEDAFDFNSLTGNGYQKLPGGLIIQWGVVPEGISPLPISFPNGTFSASAVFDAIDVTAASNISAFFPSNSQIAIYKGGTAVDPLNFKFIAIGH